MRASLRTAALMGSMALASSVLVVTAPQAVADDLGLSVRPIPPKQVQVSWDTTDQGSIDYVMVGIKPAAAPGDAYLYKTLGEADGNAGPTPSSTRLYDLNVATSYNVRVLLIKVGGGSVSETTRVQGYRMTLSADRNVVLRGRGVGLAGVLRSSGPSTSPVGNATVKIQRDLYPFGDSGWSTVATTRTNTKGAYRTTVSPAHNARFRAIYEGSGAGSWTPAEFVGVRVRISISATPRPAAFGRAAVFSGGLATPDARASGSPIQLKRRINGSWVTVGRGVVNANGRYSIPFTSQNRKDSFYRVRMAGGSYFADSRSKRIRVVVR